MSSSSNCTSSPDKKGWRVNTWVQNALGACVNLPIKKNSLIEETYVTFASC